MCYNAPVLDKEIISLFTNDESEYLEYEICSMLVLSSNLSDIKICLIFAWLFQGRLFSEFQGRTCDFDSHVIFLKFLIFVLLFTLDVSNKSSSWTDFILRVVDELSQKTLAQTGKG